MDTSKEPLLGKTLLELQLITQQLGMPRFAAKQIASWLYDKKVSSIDEMTNLSLKARDVLCQQYTVGATAPVEAQRSSDGTVKYLSGRKKGILSRQFIFRMTIGLPYVSLLKWVAR